ncbi:MAG: isoleucine--tRNA ligase [Acidimicrobiia bacterium]
MPFGPVDSSFDLVALEERVAQRWSKHDVIAAARTLRDGNEPWIFYEGPPTANGRPGLHHVWARVFKDLYPRFQTMRGRSVPRKGGWDCHGLPVEIEVEKQLGLASKQDIEAYGIAEFNDHCRASVRRYVEEWSRLTARSGVWFDTDDAYWTLDNTFVVSVWWLVKQMWDKGLVYEGHRVTPYCARCGTALSSHEVAQGYKDVVDPSIYVRFPLTGSNSAAAPDADLLVWTTTPWTLISNTLAAVGADIEYVQVHVDGERDLLLGADALERLFPEDTPTVVARFRGEQLVGWTYGRPFGFLALEGANRIVAADFVTTDDGSGIVHIAPAFGEDDYQLGKREQVPVLNPMTAEGTFDARVTPFTGRFVKDVDRDIIDDLTERGLLVREVGYEHSYPHCWRCSTPLIYWAKTSWFARTSEQRGALIRENDTVGWHPEHIKHGRFGKWLEGNIDWALSRDRYWGTPLPVWRCANGHDTCIGSVAELSALSGTDQTQLDLHRPWVDDVVITCPQCQSPAHRVAPVLDAWFDSGSMPAAQHHHPFSTDVMAAGQFPADFICEAIDQTRGWFYSLLAVNTLAFDATPYKNVVCLGHIVDEHGNKMSKSKGNVIDPFSIFDNHGADSLRWYFLSAGQPWTPRRVFEEGIRESTRKTLLTLWNVWSFFATYADLDGWDRDAAAPAATHVLDRWVLAELDDTIAVMTNALEAFDALGASTRLASFIDDLSNWYVRRSRPRFWKSSDPAAHATLHRCLSVTAQLLAPFCPFLADELWSGLQGTESSVHLSDWPTTTVDVTSDAASTEANRAQRSGMEAVRRLVGLGRSARTDSKMKTRQPLSRALLLHPGVELTDELRAEIADELNVKTLEDIDTLSGLVTFTVVPNFRKLGPKLGQKLPELKAALADADGSAIHSALESDGFVEVAGIRLEADEVEVRAQRHEHFALAQDGTWAVALDLELTDELRAEGLARELIRAVNDRRKEIGLDIADRIELFVSGDEAVHDALRSHGSTVEGEVLAVQLTLVDDGDHHLTLDGHDVGITISRV